ncbi:hypothetical protein DICPUDRAFT_74181 [Dictyostelium purpureum]|uniref:Prefoldin subunit 4 n=1 Tax=Dictyostelium purpureum TaxID=5786 RepID=F0Z709_DICPU|nr:uncharacterized protein DICPUDRAFT_74181 [Dictyostelium purpureum]EGC40295.1 hypothetical protein DICPUDRAFT_74181 [Dictyostelium purpureum]|eukprot:XP_003283231.1 hypothetical protein DICPUDRAFT_74181 [Dictyostelium purpureum]
MSTKNMINKGEEIIETEVSADDQKLINLFGRLNNRKHELLREKKVKQEELEKATDANDDIFLVDDEDTKFQYSMGEAFLELNKEETEEMVNSYISKLESSIEKIDQDLQDISDKHNELKVILYGKFKNSINLEE